MNKQKLIKYEYKYARQLINTSVVPVDITYIGSVSNKMKRQPKKVTNLLLFSLDICGTDLPISRLNMRLPYITDEIIKYSPDIVCLQQVNKTALNYFKSHNELKLAYFFVGTNINDPTTFILTKYKPTMAGRCIINNNNSYMIITYHNLIVINCSFENATYFEQIKHILNGNNIILTGYNISGTGLNDMWSKLHPEQNGFTVDTKINKMLWNITQKQRMERDNGVFYSNNIVPKSIDLIGTQSSFTLSMDDNIFEEYYNKNKMDKKYIKTTNKLIYYWLSNKFGLLAKFV